jgi:hypothetical protein
VAAVDARRVAAVDARRVAAVVVALLAVAAAASLAAATRAAAVARPAAPAGLPRPGVMKRAVPMAMTDRAVAVADRVADRAAWRARHPVLRACCLQRASPPGPAARCNSPTP